MYNQVNVFLIGRYSEYQMTIKEILTEKCHNCTVHITDSYLRPLDRDCTIEKAELSIVIADHSPHDRYGSEANWLHSITKDICSNSDKTIAIVSASKGEWDGKDIKIYCVNWTVDDDYNLKIIRDKLNNYFK